MIREMNSRNITYGFRVGVSSKRNNNNASLQPGTVSRNSGMIVVGVNLVFIRGK